MVQNLLKLRGLIFFEFENHKSFCVSIPFKLGYFTLLVTIELDSIKNLPGLYPFCLKNLRLVATISDTFRGVWFISR